MHSHAWLMHASCLGHRNVSSANWSIYGLTIGPISCNPIWFKRCSPPQSIEKNHFLCFCNSISILGIWQAIGLIQPTSSFTDGSCKGTNLLEEQILPLDVYNIMHDFLHPNNSDFSHGRISTVKRNILERCAYMHIAYACTQRLYRIYKHSYFSSPSCWRFAVCSLLCSHLSSMPVLPSWLLSVASFLCLSNAFLRPFLLSSCLSPFCSSYFFLFLALGWFAWSPGAAITGTWRRRFLALLRTLLGTARILLGKQTFDDDISLCCFELFIPAKEKTKVKPFRQLWVQADLCLFQNLITFFCLNDG